MIRYSIEVVWGSKFKESSYSTGAGIPRVLGHLHSLSFPQLIKKAVLQGKQREEILELLENEDHISEALIDLILGGYVLDGTACLQG